jgi:AcrR family transcriptional regulator
MRVKKPYHHGALREALLSQALRDLESLGLEGISLRGLAETAGVSKTAPYRHFADKRELLVTLAADGFRLLAEALETVVPPARAAESAGAAAGAVGAPPDADPKETLRALFRAYMDFARERPALYKLMISRLGYELHSEACRLNSERALSCLIRAVQAAQASGWHARQDHMSLVLSLWASVHGWATLLIDGLLPPGISLQGDDWLRAAQVLLD